MLKKIVLSGSAAAVVLGAGTAALAASGSSAAPTASPNSSSHTAAAHGKAGKQGRSELRRSLHATWVTKNAKGAGYVTHDAIRGQVTAVSSTSITVKAVDGVSQSYAVTSATKVHTRAEAKGKTGSIGEVKSGDQVAVLGTGTSSRTATRVLDTTKK